MGAPAQKTRLFLLLPRWRQILICVLLTASLGLNIAALCPGTPFLLLHADPPLDVFLPPGNYGLGSTLSLLAAHQLYVLYALIVCFSLLFPVRSPCPSHALLTPSPCPPQAPNPGRAQSRIL